MQRECICIHIGQCGVQIGNAMWELFCIEHGIQFDGRPISCMGQSDPSKTFFLHSVGEKVIPRVVMVDLEPTVLDEVRVGKFKDLFHPDQLITGKEDAANNYARGRYTVGKEILGSVVGAVRKVVEQCENLQGLMVFNSAGGGTGSGLGAAIKENLAQEYSKKCRLEFVVTSAPEMASSVVEPYNSVLSTHSSRQSDFSNCTFVMDNEALYDICKKKLGIQLPKYQTVNRLLAQVVSSITTSLRFEGVSNVDLIDLHINLVPFPKMHFSITSYAPIINQVKVFHEQLGVGDITSECFKSSNQQVKCDTQKGKFISCCLLYRGDVVPKDINTAVSAIKNRKTLQFVSWCPTGFKIGINSQPPANFPNEEIAKVQRAVCMLANTTAIIDPWSKLGKKFDLLFSKRAFVHWYVSEGMEEEEFIESRCDLEMLYMDYMEIQKDTTSNAMTEDEI